MSELIALRPDVAVLGISITVKQVLEEAPKQPIVFVGIGDPVSQGLVTNLARPGGNATGFLAFEPSLGGKWVETLKSVAPGVDRMAFIYDPLTAPFAVGMFQAGAAAASSLGVTLTETRVHDVAELSGAIVGFAREPAGGLVLTPGILTNTNVQLIISLAATHRMPAIYARQSLEWF